jgi:hypothetical protein
MSNKTQHTWRCFALTILLFFISVAPLAHAGGWSIDTIDASGEHVQYVYTNASDISKEVFQINSTGPYMYYTDLPSSPEWNISVDVNAQDLKGFFISVVSHLPMNGHKDGFGCGISPYDSNANHTGSFHQSSYAIFDQEPQYEYKDWEGGWGLYPYKENQWYTIFISATNPNRLNMIIFNETGGNLGGTYVTFDDYYKRPVNGYVGFGTAEKGGNYTVKNVKIYPAPLCTEPSIALNCQSTTSYSNFKVNITGYLTCNNTPLANEPLMLSYSNDNGDSWINLTSVTTDNDGAIFADWNPSASGNYLVKATFEGDTVYSSVSQMTSFVVLPFNEQNVFSVTSNSTISAFSFNSSTSELSFTASGPNGTRGHTTVLMPKSLIGNLDSIKVLVDGNQVNYTVTSIDESIALTFDYSHSTHYITIKASNGTNPSETINFWLLAVIAIVFVVSIIGIVVLFFRQDKLKQITTA